MEVEDYFIAEGVIDSGHQALTARDYLSLAIKKRIMMARLHSDPRDAAKF
jgi:hypothetical protein